MPTLNFLQEKSALSKEYLNVYNVSMIVVSQMNNEGKITKKESEMFEEYVISQLYQVKLKRDLQDPNLRKSEKIHIERQLKHYQERVAATGKALSKHLNEFNSRTNAKLQEQENKKQKGKGAAR